MENDADLLRHILTYKIDPSFTDAWHWEGPVNEAAKNGNIEILRMLIDRGFDIELHANEFKGWPFTPLVLALEGGLDETAVFLIKTGARTDIDIKEFDVGYYNIIRIDEPDIRMPMDETRNMLDLAVLGGNLEAAKLLVQKGFNPRKLSSWKENLLFYATNADVAEYLIDQGLSVRRRLIQKGNPLLIVPGSTGTPE